MTRPMLTQREAATACGVSRTTIRRRREAGDLPNAVQDPQRGWLIPVEDLLAAGLRLHAPTGPDVPAPPAGDGGDRQEPDAVALQAALDQARREHARELAEAQHGRELAEATAEHLRDQLEARLEHIGDLQRALAALMPPPERAELPTVPGQSQSRTAPADDAKRTADERQRRWWRRT